MDDYTLAMNIVKSVRDAGGRAFFVGGYVRDMLMGVKGKDIDIEVFGITPARLRELLKGVGSVIDKGAAFGVLGLLHSDLDIAMPRRESRTGGKHTDFDVAVDPFMSYEDASMRRDFTMNAMMFEPISGEIIDCWHGRADLENRVIRHVSGKTFGDDALRVFRACQFAARLEAKIAPETMDICRGMDVRDISNERVYDETVKALLKARVPSVYFRTLAEMGKLGEFFPELQATIGVMQNPKYHPEGDVFTHAMLVLDSAAYLRSKAKEPVNFMLAALMHDLGKANATEIIDGRITSYRHPDTGVPLAETQIRRLTNNARTIAYVKNMVELHMRPNMMAAADSRKQKSRAMFDMSLCPEDLILLSRADAEGKKDAPYDEKTWDWLCARLEDYRLCMARPMVTGKDLLAAGYAPGPDMGLLVKRGRQLHFAGIEKTRALSQILHETPPRGTPPKRVKTQTEEQ